ncbi:T9SS type A sorting domain-containing protein, partial [candidate division KSB1 bacterium]|nr:T9SS type A sorting domain-containing protein [candidate division KSB1 bacterium]
YIVTDDLILNSGSELVIEPGTEIWFRENSKLEVQPGARIIAEGTVADTIVFRGAPVKADSNTCWGGVRLLMADEASSFSYCKFTDGYSSPFIFSHELDNYGGAMLIYGSNITVSHSTFSGNRASGAGGALAIFDCDPIIRFCDILDNYSENDAGAIFVQNSRGLIRNSLIARNSCLYDGGAIYCDGQADIEVTNTRIVRNYSGDDGGAGLCYDSEPRFINCTIVDNITEGHGGAFRNSTSSSTVSITNSIVWRNDGSSITRGSISVTYSCVQLGISSSGNNILRNPEFQSTESLDYLLAANSPCIDAGNPAAEYNDPEDPNNPGQALYPALGTLRNDMGAYGGPRAVEQDMPVAIADDLNDSNVPEYFELKPCYPNPFNAWTIIEFELPEDAEVEVSIYNITGQKLQSFDRRQMQAGVHRIQWNANDVSSGVYIIRMATTKFSETRKVMLIK